MATARTTESPNGRTGKLAELGILPVAVMLIIMWVSEVADTIANGRLDRYGIEPRKLWGLDGIAFAPFLHGGFAHLIANTIPFALMGAAIAIGAAKRFLSVTLIVGLVGGVGTWLTGPANTIHIGASGLVFGYLTYLLSRGVFARNFWYLLGGVVTFMIYGGVLWGLLPAPGISWQGHLFGAVGGIVAAYLLHADRDKQPGTSTAKPRRTLMERLSPPEI
ncbi:MAG TPA: rhomboid family intramembrane serine protease [Ilumatobacter sp.]|nr:rhomboid family intramembrane serine protease [Ilumatobacter sp.]